MEALEEYGGRIMVFASSISSIGVGKVQTRSKAELFNTPDEAAKMMSPDNDFYSLFVEKNYIFFACKQKDDFPG